MQLGRKWLAVRTMGSHGSDAAPNGSAPGPVGSGCSKCRIRAQDRRLGRPCSGELVARAHGGAPQQPDFQPRRSARMVGAPPPLHPCPRRAPPACPIRYNIAAQAACPPVMPYLPRCGSLFAGGVFGVAAPRRRWARGRSARCALLPAPAAAATPRRACPACEPLPRHV